ncbi:uncharacterized protein FYW23_000988 isoform 1-T1 [Sylvia borin]
MRSRAPDAEVCWRSGSRGSRPGLSRAAAPAVPGGASPTGNTEYLSLVLVAVRAVCRGWAGCTHSGALPGGWGAPVRCRSEIKPCTCLTYPGVSWRLVNTTRCVRTRSCGRAALAPFSGTCERYRAENKDIQTLSHLEEEEAKICARGLTAGFTHGFRSIYRSTDEYDKNYKGNMNLLHVVMWRKIRCRWRAGPELLFQGYEDSLLPLPSPACEKETDIISLARMTQLGRSLYRISLLPAF